MSYGRCVGPPRDGAAPEGYAVIAWNLFKLVSGQGQDQAAPPAEGGGCCGGCGCLLLLLLVLGLLGRLFGWIED